MDQPLSTAGSIPYPSGLPLEAIKDIIRIIKDGSVTEERASLAKDIWLVQGYAQSQLLGDPDQGQLVGKQSVAVPPVLILLEAVVAQQEPASGDELLKQSAAGLIVPVQLLLNWALKELMKLLEQELGSGGLSVL